MSYRKYDPMVMKMIIETGNRNLFPELNIPRTTINYWLKNSKTKVTSKRDIVFEKRISHQDKEIFNLKAKNCLIKNCLVKLLEKSDSFSRKSLEDKKYIISMIDEYKEFLTLREILHTLNISHSTFYRWRVQVLGCDYNKEKKCNVIRANSLTQNEQSLLVRYATSKSFKKFSTVSLMYYCRRKNMFNISLDSWYKYLNLYSIDRHKYRLNPLRKYKNGIRAKKSNQIRHIDITEIKYDRSKKAYLQLVVDNFSRLIIAWKLSHHKKATVTRENLLKSFQLTPEFTGDIITDSGSENTAKEVQKLIWGRGIRHIIAKKDIHFSNSMVEAVFRQLKQKFLTKESSTFSGLYQKIYKFTHQYNKVIPHSSLEGATPAELYEGSFERERFKEELKERLFLQRKRRREKFLNCQKCQKKYLREESIWT